MQKEIVGFDGKVSFDKTKPDGTMLKKLDTTLINKLGWKPKIKLKDGLKATYNWALQSKVFDR